jgi:hypothetical protein
MRNKLSQYFMVVCVVVVLGLSVSPGVQAASEDTKATKRAVYQDDSTESMAEVNLRRDAEEKEYRQAMLSNGEESIALLIEIRDLLAQLNAREEQESLSQK